MSKRIFCPACSKLASECQSLTVIAPWIRELAGVKNRTSKYFICNKCGTGWVDANYSPPQMQSLYDDYRGQKYLKIRRKWEITYTVEFNSSIDGGKKHMELRRSQMQSLLIEDSPNFVVTAKAVLDIGGGHGSLIPNWSDLKEKYVLDVSGVETLDGIVSIKEWSEIREGQILSLVMACGILEHLTSPKDFLDSIVSEISNYNLMNEDSLFYFEVPAGVPSREKFKIKFIFAFLMSFNPKLWQLYDKIQERLGREKFPMRIAEHIQFFSPEGMKALLSASNLEYVGSKIYSAKESLEDPSSIRFGEILGVVARIPKSV